jgi:hypothetical protein
MNVVIVGARERRETEADKEKIEQLLQGLMKQYSSQLNVLSVGCDKGIGKLVREFCIQSKIVFAEVRIKFEGEDIKRQFFAHMFLARNKALLEVGDEYYVYKGPNPNGIIEALIEPARLRVGVARVTVHESETA